MTNKCLRCGRPLKDPLADYGPVCGKKVEMMLGVMDTIRLWSRTKKARSRR